VSIHQPTGSDIWSWFVSRMIGSTRRASVIIISVAGTLAAPSDPSGLYGRTEIDLHVN
jgi:hypothetical protein